jgi:YD repeat-containing protein
VVPSATLVHAATGTPLVNFIEDVITTEGTSGQFVLPHTDQTGFQDEAGNSYQNWYYTATITYATDKGTLPPRTKTFQLTTGQTVVDLDLLATGAPVLPYTAQTATVTSFAGRTGAVTVQDADLPNRLSDTSLNATYASANPTLVVTYNADGTVATTTENGVLTTFTYNADLTVHTQTRAGVTKTFTYDANGNVTGAA